MIASMLYLSMYSFCAYPVVDEGSEGRVAKQSLEEATVALVLLQDAGVLAAQVGGFLSLEGNLAFELADVFCFRVSIVLEIVRH